MKKKIKKSIGLLVIMAIFALGGINAFAYVGGNSYTGASSYEVWQIKYNGAAWNYSKSPYIYTGFKYKRGGRTLLNRLTWSSKVKGSVWDDLRWGEKYKTHFSWYRGPRK